MCESGRRREVGAPRDRDGTEPGLVCVIAVRAVAGEGVLGGRSCVARDLLEGFVEVLVGFVGVGVVNPGEFGHVDCGGRGNGIGNVGAET